MFNLLKKLLISPDKFIIGLVLFLLFMTPALAASSSGSLSVSLTVLQSGPVVTSVIPSSGSRTGVTNISITGSGFSGTTSLTLEGTNGNSNLNISSYTVVNDNTITTQVAAGLNPGTYNVKVSNSVGTSPNNHPGDQFTVTAGGGTVLPSITGIYPSSGANTGVTYVAIVGDNFTGTSSVSIEGVPVASWQVITDEQINATIQAGLVPGIKTIKVSNQVGTSPDNHPGDQFTVTAGGGTVSPTVTSVVPNTGPDNVATPIVINGSNFTGTQGVRIGSTSIPFQVQNDSAINAIVPAGMIPGPYHVTVSNQVGTSPTGPNDIFTVTYSGSGPFVTDVVPDSGANTSATNVVISGFNFTGANTVTIGGVPVQSFNVVNANTINAVIQSGLTPRIYHVRVTTPVSQSPETPADEFTVTSGGGGSSPTITGVTPNTGSNLQNTPVVISGSNFTGTTSVQIGGTPIPYLVVNDGEIQATIPSGLPLGTQNITVTNPNGTSNGIPFTITAGQPGPQVWYIQPSSGANTSTTNLTINGIYFTGATAVKIGSTPVQSYTFVNDGQISAVIQAGLTPGDYHIQVTTAVGTSSAVPADIFTVTAGGGTGIPTVTSINPNSGANLYEVPIVVRGTNFTGTQAVLLIQSFSPYGTTLSTHEVISDTEIRAIVPAGLSLGTYNVKVTNTIGTSPDNHPVDQYTVTGTNAGNSPAVTGVSPNSGPNNVITTVSIGGTNFTGATAVTIGGTPVQGFTPVSPTEITAVIQSGITPGTYHIQVTTPNATSSQNPADQFTVTAGGPTPTVTGINPNSGANDQTTPVTITGTNLGNPTSVQIGNTPIPATPVSATQVNTTVPTGMVPGTYYITVTTPTGTSTTGPSSQFTVLPPTGAPATPEGLTMTKSSSDLILGWTISSTTNVDHYNIYRGTAPNFVPGASNRIGTSTTLSYTDSGALSASDNYYYRVTAQSASGAESMVSNIGYKLNRHLTYNTSISNINWISLPYRTPYTNADSIAKDIPAAITVSRFNPDTQLYEHWVKFLGSWVGTNFNVKAGESYLVIVNTDSDIRLVGWHDRNTTISMIHHTAISNINWISIPYHSTYTRASDIAQAVPQATTISRWNQTTQNYEHLVYFLGIWVGIDFNIIPGEGQEIIINSNVNNWKPSTNN